MGDISAGAASNPQSGPFASANEGRLVRGEDEASIRIGQLHSAAQAELFSAIDRLRHENVGHEISIPQIVVCGSQSSGKSSVLEAIAGVRFPIGSETVTRFATEVILRRSNQDLVDINVNIIPAEDREHEIKQRLQAFRPSRPANGPEDFGRLINEAYKHLQDMEPNAKFWKDRLRAEISGPTQPHLTLIDLPGIIQYESTQNAITGDKARILDLVTEYVQAPGSTVIAVVDAMNDIENQEILRLATETAKDRTIGVITKPDLMTRGSDLEAKVIRVAQNTVVSLRLGWHAVRNIAHEKNDRSYTRRDQEERQFFETGKWGQLSSENWGIESLRTKLSKRLLMCITDDLHRLREVTKAKRRQCEEEIDRLGPARATVAQQRSYLLEVLKRLSRLTEAALYGHYDDVDEFKSFFDGPLQKKLRDRMRDETSAFATRMRQHGKQYHIYTGDGDGDGDGESIVIKSSGRLQDIGEYEEPNFSAPFTTATSGPDARNRHTRNVPLQAYCKSLAIHMRLTRGMELEGLLTTRTIKAIFRQLSLPWKEMAETFVEDSCEAVYTFLKLAIKYVAEDHTAEALLRAYVYPAGSGFDDRRSSLETKVQELLWPYRECHPMTYLTSFNSRTEPESSSGDSPQAETWAEIARANGYNKAYIDAAHALDQTEGYYDLALGTFIENVASLGVERCLLHGLQDLIPLSEVTDLDDNKIAEIAGESADIVNRRARAISQKAALDHFIRICNNYRPRREVPAPIIDDAEAQSAEDTSNPQMSIPGRSDGPMGGRRAPSTPNTRDVHHASASQQTSTPTNTGGIRTSTQLPTQAPGFGAQNAALGPSSGVQVANSNTTNGSLFRTVSPAATVIPINVTPSTGSAVNVTSSSNSQPSMQPYFGTASISKDKKPEYDSVLPRTSSTGGFGSFTNGSSPDGTRTNGLQASSSTPEVNGSSPRSSMLSSGFGTSSLVGFGGSSATAQGSPSGGGLFGLSTSTTENPFGGRPSSTEQNGPSPSGGIFGQRPTSQPPPSGSSGSLGFGQSPFGNNNSGKSSSISFYTPTQGTKNLSFRGDETIIDYDGYRDARMQSVTALDKYGKVSFEELRLDDYNSDRIRPQEEFSSALPAT